MNRARTVCPHHRQESLPTLERIIRGCALLWLLLLMIAVIPAYQIYSGARQDPRPESAAAAPAAATLAAAPTPTVVHYLPILGKQNPNLPPLQLAFLKDGDLWLAKITQDTDWSDEWLQKHLPGSDWITQGWKAISFAWSPDGEYIAAFDGSKVQFVHVDSKTVKPPAIELGLDQPQKSAIPALMWTPDGRHVVLWNIQNPYIGDSVGWFIISPDFPENLRYEEGRVVKMLSLANGSLIVIVARSCDRDPCPLDLLRYEPTAQKFTTLDLDTFRQQGGVGILGASAGLMLQDATDVECGFYADSPAALTLNQRRSPTSQEGKEMPYDFLLAPDGSSVLITRGVACNDQISAKWMEECWPGGGPDPYKMTLWDGQEGEDASLTVPGVFPHWSADSRWVAFQSCLAATPIRDLAQTETAPPWIYVLDINTLIPERLNEENGILPVSEGHFPAWRPIKP